MSNPLEFIFPRIKEERRLAGKDKVSENSPGKIPDPPPLIGETKNKVILAIEGTSLIATGAAVFTQGTKQGLKTVGKGALTGLIGSSAGQIALANGPFLLGPVNEAIEDFGAAIGNERHLIQPDRPFIDLQGPARSLIGILSFLPGTNEAAARKSREILQRDLQPKVDDLIAQTEGIAASQDVTTTKKIFQLQQQFNLTLDFIESGGNPTQLQQLALGIDARIVQLWDTLTPQQRDTIIASYLNPQGLHPPKYGPFVKFIISHGKDGLQLLTPNRGDP